MSTSEAPIAEIPSTLNIDYTDEQGWHYTCAAEMPQVSPTVEKDISSSPPGEAGIAGSAGTFPFQGLETSCDPDNPGRPDGPALEVEFDKLALQQTSAAAEANGAGSEDTALCRSITPEIDNSQTALNGFPFPTYAYCYNLQGQARIGRSGGLDETTVDSVVSGTSTTQYAVLWNVGGISNDCFVAVYSDGAFKKARTWDDAECGTISATA